MDGNTFDPDLIVQIFKLVWTKTAAEREKNENLQNVETEAGTSKSKKGKSKKGRITSAHKNALILSCELLRRFVTEAINRASSIAEAEGSLNIEATHLERILPQLLLDF